MHALTATFETRFKHQFTSFVVKIVWCKLLSLGFLCLTGFVSYVPLQRKHLMTIAAGFNLSRGNKKPSLGVAFTPTTLAQRKNFFHPATINLDLDLRT